LASKFVQTTKYTTYTYSVVDCWLDLLQTFSLILVNGRVQVHRCLFANNRSINPY